jgi:transposase
MLGLGAATRVYVATGATDMRLGIEGLHALVVGQLQQDPLSGHLFLFANKRRDRLKAMYFDGSGMWVCAKRMQGGRLYWPDTANGRVQLTHEELALLIGGIDLKATAKRKWFRREMEKDVDESIKAA